MMKKILILFLAVWMLNFTTKVKASELLVTVEVNTPKLGLLSELVDLKYKTEAFMAKKILETDGKPAETDVAHYNMARRRMDRIIYQLMADMRKTNSICMYRRLDKASRKNTLITPSEVSGKRTKNYALAFKELSDDINKWINPPKTESTLAVSEILDVALGVVELGWTIFKDVEEMRGKKVDGITALLDKMRMASVQELVKGLSEEKKEN